MIKLRMAILVMVAVLVSVSVCESYTKVGRTSKKKKNYASSMEYSPIKYNLIVKGNFGTIDIADDDIPALIKFSTKIYYGYGIGFEYHTSGKFAFGIQYDKLFKNYKVSDEEYQFLLKSYTISTIYKFKTKTPTIPIAMIQYGTANPDIENAELAKTFKVGLGVIGHTSGKINLRGIFYYQQFFSSEDLEKYTEIDNLNVFGVEVIMGIPL